MSEKLEYGKWISVDITPPEGVIFLIGWFNDDEPRNSFNPHKFVDGEYMEMDDFLDDEHETGYVGFTHWLPIPPLPKGGEE